MQNGPCILVGHSYGGAIITEAGDDPHVAELVYIAAYKSLQKAADGFDYVAIDKFYQDFAADLPKARQNSRRIHKCRQLMPYFMP